MAGVASKANAANASWTNRQRWMDQIANGFLPLNGFKEPIVNKFLKLCNSAKLKILIEGICIWLIALSVMVGYALVRVGCVDADVTIVNCVLLVFAMIVGGGGPVIKQTGCCPAMSLLATMINFITDSLLLAIFVQRITSPKATIRISDTMLLKMRNNTLLFQLRVMNEFGHALENVVVSASLYRPAVSEEGEDYTEIYPIEFQSSYVCHAPMNVSHFIDDTSPLFGEDLENFRGAIEVSVSGLDSTLGATASRTMVYNSSVLKIGHQFESVFIEGPKEVIDGAAAKLSVNAAKLSSTEPLSDEIVVKLKSVIALNISQKLQYGISFPAVHKLNASQSTQLHKPLSRAYITERNFTTIAKSNPLEARGDISNGSNGVTSRSGSVDLEEALTHADASKSSPKRGILHNMFKRRNPDTSNKNVI